MCSTDVIGVPLDMPALLAGAGRAAGALAPTPEAGHDAARAIMTTDTVPKEDAVSRTADGVAWSVGGMIKGVGMLAPGLATMLCVITTDAVVDAAAARAALSGTVAQTVNRINFISIVMNIIALKV